MSYPERSPLARLVLFMVCLSVAGSLPAGAGYAVFALPEEISAAHPPSNYGLICKTCPGAFPARLAAFFVTGRGCYYQETHDEPDFIFYEVCCPR